MFETVVGAVIIKDNALLLVRHPESGLWITPGGKAVPGETDRQALRRELAVTLPEFVVTWGPAYYMITSEIALTSKGFQNYIFYKVRGGGSIKPGVELSEVAWVSDFDAIRLAAATKKLVETLKREGYLVARNGGAMVPEMLANVERLGKVNAALFADILKLEGAGGDQLAFCRGVCETLGMDQREALSRGAGRDSEKAERRGRLYAQSILFAGRLMEGDCGDRCSQATKTAIAPVIDELIAISAAN